MSCWQLNLVLSKSLTGGTSFEPIGGSWRTAEGIASVTVERLGLKRSWRRVDCVPYGRIRIPEEKSEATVESATHWRC